MHFILPHELIKLASDRDMFTTAILIGIYSYIIFLLGVLGFIYTQHIILLTVIYLTIALYWYREKLKMNLPRTVLVRGLLRCFEIFKKIQKPYLEKIFLGIIILQTLINLVGVLGPELAFDALWYHLTLPKIYITNHSISHIPGGLLYYSDMPKLTEMLYVSALTFGNEITAKFIHFSFGILILIAIHKISRKFFSKEFSLLTVVLFYSNLVVGWQSTTAYIDLARTFFEIMALWGFLNWMENKKNKWFILSSVMLGLAISAKLLAIGSLLIFSILISYYFWKNKISVNNYSICLFVYLFICLLIVSPWFIFSFLNTGNPVYPFFTNIYPLKINVSLINTLSLSDPISPLYVILVPVGILLFTKLEFKIKMISLYCFLASIVWQLTPNTGGGRFILPYLPGFSILSIWVIREIRLIRVQYMLIGAIIIFSVFSIIYRLSANSKYMPVIIGKESKADFLKNHLNFSFGDFYDLDGYFAKKIKASDNVLLYGFHNLYYIDFPFVDSSWVKKGDKFNYVAVQNSPLPKKFKNWNLIYSNAISHVKLYSKPRTFGSFSVVRGKGWEKWEH